MWHTTLCCLSVAGDVIQLKGAPGSTFSIPDLKAAVAKHKPAVLFLVQGESSTGTHQVRSQRHDELSCGVLFCTSNFFDCANCVHVSTTSQALGGGLGEACHAAGTLLVVDTVASLGGVPLLADEWGIDCIYSGSQKCLGGPPGASPFMMSQRAVDKLLARKTKPATYNLDMNLIAGYWGWFTPSTRSYHHTGVVSTFYAMREALAIVGEEGLTAMWDRHLAAHKLLWEGLAELGLEPFVPEAKDRCVVG